MDRAGPGTSSGQEGLAAHPCSTKRRAGARPINGAPAFTWPASGTPYFGWQVACFQTTCTDGGTEWLSVELLELNMAETTGPALSANRRPLGHGKHLDPGQLAIGLRRRLALRRLQPQRFAERHQHPRIQLGAEPVGLSPVRRANRAADDQHRPIRQRRAAAQTQRRRCRRPARRGRVDRLRRQRSPSASASAARPTHRFHGRHSVHNRDRVRRPERSRRDRVLARRRAVPVLLRVEHAARGAGGRRAPRELLCEQQRRRSQRRARDVAGAELDAQHPGAVRRNRRVLARGQRAAMLEEARACPDSRPLDDGAVPRAKGARQSSGADPHGHDRPLPSEDRSPPRGHPRARAHREGRAAAQDGQRHEQARASRRGHVGQRLGRDG